MLVEFVNLGHLSQYCILKVAILFKILLKEYTTDLSLYSYNIVRLMMVIRFDDQFKEKGSVDAPQPELWSRRLCFQLSLSVCLFVGLSAGL